MRPVRPRCDHCGSDRCAGLCAPRAAYLAKMKIIAFLRAKGDPKAAQWADEIERSDHDDIDIGL